MRFPTRFLLPLLLLAACGDSQSGATARRKPAAILGEAKTTGQPKQVGKFQFLESQGRAIGNDELRGKVWVASFMFSRCTTYCVSICREASRLQAEFGKNKDFRIVCTTVDPAYDTAPVLRKFAKTWKANPDTWYFLTGDRSEIQKFSYDIGIAGDPDEITNHSVYFVVVDREGTPRGYFDAQDKERVKAMHTLVREQLEKK